MFITLARVFRTLSGRDRLLFLVSVFARVILVGLDMIGMAFVGLAVSMVSQASISGESLSGRVISYVAIFFPVNTYAVVAVLSVIFFTLKALLSVLLNHHLARWTANLVARKSSAIYERALTGNLDAIKHWSSKDFLSGLMSSSQSAFGISILSSSVILGEFVLIVAVASTLAILDFELLLYIALFFGLVGFSMNKGLSRANSAAGLKAHVSGLELHATILESLANFRQIAVTGNPKGFAGKFSQERMKYAQASSVGSTISVLPRYVAEVALMLGVGLLVIQRVFDPSGGSSISTIAIFLAGIFRVISSMVTMQGSILAIKNLETASSLALDMEEKIPQGLPGTDSGRQPAPSQTPNIVFRHTTYNYEGRRVSAISGVSFEIPFGAFVAVKGKSGAGKSTLVDLLLGLRKPNAGLVLLGGVGPDAFRRCGGVVAYVPQSSVVMSGTIRDNLLLGREPKDFSDSRLMGVLDACGLGELMGDLPLGLDTVVDSENKGLSGGQAQRLSIARALVAEPSILILDESTSALDAHSEELIKAVLAKLKGKVTIISISHNDRISDLADSSLVFANGHVTLFTH